MKCLIIDEMHPSITSLLDGINLAYDYAPTITTHEVEQVIANYEGLILRSKLKLTKALLSKGEKLRFVARAGAGVDQIDESFLAERKITLINAPEGNRDAVGEHALGMLLTLFNRLNTADLEVRQKMWLREENRGYEVKGKTVGIIGYGNMGKAFAKRLKGFECRVIAFDKYKSNYGDEHAEAVDLEMLREEADVVSLHIPLDEYNYYLFDNAYLDAFKKNIYLINLARGPVVPLNTLVYGLKTGKLLGAALDVLENEKLETLTAQQQADFEFLTKQSNVLFTPHVGGWTFESYQRINEVLVKKIDGLLNQ